MRKPPYLRLVPPIPVDANTKHVAEREARDRTRRLDEMRRAYEAKHPEPFDEREPPLPDLFDEPGTDPGRPPEPKPADADEQRRAEEARAFYEAMYCDED